MKMNGAFAGNSLTGRQKFMARKWAALIGFLELKTRSRFKKVGGRSKRLVMQRRCALWLSIQSRNNKLTLIDNSTGCGLVTMSRKTSGNTDSTTVWWKIWKNRAGHLHYGLHPVDRTGNLGYGGGWSRKTTHQSYHPINSEKIRKTTPTSNVVRPRKLIAVNYSFFLENVWNEGATQTGHGRSTITVAKHEKSGGNMGGGVVWCTCVWG